MGIEIVKMYVDNIDGKGTYILTLVDKWGDKYQGEVEIHGSRVDLEFIKLNEE